MKSHRVARINEVIREVAAETILFKMADPRVKKVTVTRADTSADLQHAKVYISVMGSERDERATIAGLTSAAGYIQSKLADRLKTRFLPTLTFMIDQGLKNSMTVDRLLAAERQRDADTAPAEEDDLDVEGVSTDNDPEAPADAPA